MNIWKVCLLTVGLALAFGVGTVTATAADAHHSTQSKPTKSAPFSAHRLLQMPEFQPNLGTGQQSIGDGTTLGYSLNGWKYQVNYQYTSRGWRFIGYTATRIHMPGGHRLTPLKVDSHRGVAPHGSTNTMLVSPISTIPNTDPPNPSDFNDPTDPSNPDHTNSESHDYCNWNSSGWNVHIDYVWVPTHTVENDDGSSETIPSQWVIENLFYTQLKTSFCP